MFPVKFQDEFSNFVVSHSSYGFESHYPKGYSSTEEQQSKQSHPVIIFVMENIVAAFKQVYLIDITDLEDRDKWYDFFAEYLDGRLHGNDSAYDLYWDEFDCPEVYIEGHDITLHQEFKKMMTEAGIPTNAEVWLKYWW